MRHYYRVTTPPAPGPAQPADPPTSPGSPASTPGPVALPQPPPPPGGYQVPPGYQIPPGYQAAPGYPGRPGYAYPAPPVSPGGIPLAEPTQRLLARIVDGLIVGGISSVIFLPISCYVLFAIVPPNRTINGVPIEEVDPARIFLPMLGLLAAICAVSVVLGYLYYAELMFRSGQTFGKRLLKIQIRPVNPTQQLTRRQAARRYFADLGMGFVPVLSLVNVLFLLWDKPYQQCLHDKFADTLVTKLTP